MNKHSSILWLMIQSSFSKIMALLTGISAVQMALFVWAFQQLSVAEYSLEQTLVQGQAARAAIHYSDWRFPSEKCFGGRHCIMADAT